MKTTPPLHIIHDAWGSPLVAEENLDKTPRHAPTMKITDVETELRIMAAILAGTSQGQTCALAADIVHEHGQVQHERLRDHMTAIQTNIKRFPVTNDTP